MEEHEIKRLINMLDWNNDSSIIAEGMRNLESIDRSKMHHLLFMENVKNTWENCAKVIVARDIKDLFDIIPQLFEWLQDPNWPGYPLIYKKLLDAANEDVFHGLDISIKKAADTKDADWMGSLKRLYSAFCKGKQIPLVASNPGMLSIADW